MLLGENTPRISIKNEAEKRGRKKERSTAFFVKEEAQLFEFVLQKMGGMSRTAVKGLLTHQNITVNGNVVTQFDYALKKGDSVSVCFSKKENGLRHPKIKILYEDDYLIVVHKAEGLLSVATEKEEPTTAFRIIMNHMKKQNPKNRVYVVHRLDRETSGVLVFAKTKEVQEALQTYWHHDVLEKIYYAVVDGIMEEDKGTITSWLTESPKSKIVYASPTDNGGEKAILHYETIKRNNKYSLVKINLVTGKKNQIRVQLQSIGHPISGDKKYGSEHSPLGRIALHAAKLTLRHPATGQRISFESPIPENMKMNF
ncbi:MAG: RluA family pseudouridine synthase [Paludibacteraceae bacterium]|nr:RluA family pseudouridine synthase [Paludibacteraceae bacterium]